MKPKVYIETSVISYLTAKLSRDLITAGHQKITQEWWKHRRQEFTLHISQLVVKEASAGHGSQQPTVSITRYSFLAV
jgi:hypothetical protein